jgi:two-component system sensor histidine kinase KdpD
MSEAPREYGLTIAAAALCTAACYALAPVLSLADLVMVYLVGTLVVALRGRRGPALFSSLLGVLCFDFFFVPPRFTFHVEHPQYVVTFVVMFAVALVISHLAVRVRSQAEAAKRAEVVAETERLRSSLLSAVSHELRTPLAAIVGSASTLLRAPESAGETRRDLLENIRGEADRLTRLVHNLIETTRLESGASLKKELYPIEDVIGTALERVEKLLAGRRVETDLPENLPLVPLDPVLMELVFVNLLENAALHAPAGALDIVARERMDFVEVSVSDRGPGLKPEELERVFEKFYRASAAPGAGLGLAICKAVVAAHGGAIRAENRHGGGAVFILTLPRGGAK